jgi:hypothetical protein
MDSIEPLTDAELRITVESRAGLPVEDATVTATVYDPKGQVVATDAACPRESGNTYVLSIGHAWSERSGAPLLGEYTAYVKVLRAGARRTHRVRYAVQYPETGAR